MPATHVTGRQKWISLPAILLLFSGLAAWAAPKPISETAAGGDSEFEFYNTQQELEMPHALPDQWVQSLTNAGIDYVLMYSSEMEYNARGGRRRGGIISGNLEAGIFYDFEKRLNWRGGSFYASAVWSHGPSLSEHTVGDLYGGSSMESLNSLSLYEVWLQQDLLDGAISLRAGQLAADREFLGTDTGTLFTSATFGWPAILGLGTPAPTYPTATPGIRLRVDPHPHLYLQAAVYNGNPAMEDAFGNSVDTHGLYYNFNQGALFLFEGGILTEPLDEPTRYPGVYKVGGWYHTSSFDDEVKSTDGRYLADPFSNHHPIQHPGNYGWYVVAEQKVYRPKSAVEDQGLSLFVRVASAPSDRNLVSFYLDGGFHYVGLIPGRPHDVFGAAASYSRMSKDLRKITAEYNFYENLTDPMPDYESIIEVTYRAEIKPWWYVQPHLQYILHPGGSPLLPDALILGLRTTLSF